MTDEQKEKCKQIVEHYGFEGQRDILVEECAELIKAVSKIKRNGGAVSGNFLEELADVSIMIEQMKQALSDDEVIRYLSYINRKIERQIARMQGIPERNCKNCWFYGMCDKNKGYCGERIPKSTEGETT